MRVKKSLTRISLILTIALIGFCSYGQGKFSSWHETLENKQGKISIQFRDTEPFLILSDNQTLKGIEYEVIQGFKYFLNNRYGIQLDIEWVRRESFIDVYDYIKDDAENGEFGLSIISYTPERALEVGFSYPYFPDVQIMVSNLEIAPVISTDSFVSKFNEYTAITVPATTYEQTLDDIKREFDMDFDVEFVKNSNDVIPAVSKNKRSFGYVDLPNYFMSLSKKPLVHRQNVPPVQGPGYCIIFPRGSDWDEPMNAYFTSNDFETLINRSAEKYLGGELKDLMDQVSGSSSTELVLLKKEKEIADQALVRRLVDLEQEAWIRNFLIGGLIVLLGFAYVLFNRNKVKSKANEILTIHRELIESQNNQLTKRNDELVNLNEDKNNFIRILSHDLRAPVNNVIGLTKVFQMESNELNKEQVDLLNHIQAESERLNRMIARILSVEKIESNKKEEFQEIDLGQVMRASAKNFEAKAGEKDITIKYELQDGLVTMGLEEYMYHIFDNLISNAIKFSPKGKSITIGLKAMPNILEASITDEGPGLSEDDKKKLFRKFQRLSAKPTGGEHSTGIGLSIVQKYVQLSKAYISCRSQLGNGASFVVKFSKV